MVGINNDGSSTNDLIYVPTTTEIATMTFSGGPTQGEASDISQDKYLVGVEVSIQSVMVLYLHGEENGI
jgi:hypothetical protein